MSSALPASPSKGGADGLDTAIEVRCDLLQGFTSGEMIGNVGFKFS